MDRSLASIDAAQAGCERIRSTPIPFAYILLLHRTAYVYCYLLPFGLVDAIGLMTPVVVAIVAYTFVGLDALGDEIEDPFVTSAHHLPLVSLCRSIEITLLETLGEENLPPPIRPQDGYLD
jgi:putative membrane protein